MSYETFVLFPTSTLEELQQWAKQIDDDPKWDNLECKFIDNTNSSAGMMFWVSLALNTARPEEYKFKSTYKKSTVRTMYFSRYRLEDI